MLPRKPLGMFSGKGQLCLVYKFRELLFAIGVYNSGLNQTDFFSR